MGHYDLLFEQLVEDIFMAARGGQLDEVRRLLGTEVVYDTGAVKKITPDIRREYESPLLHAASSSDNGVLVSFLVEQGAPVNVADKDGDQALHLSAILGHRRSSQALIEKGADLNAQNERGRTPLHVAVMHERGELAVFFVERGADLGVRNRNGHTPIMADILFGNGRITCAMLSAARNSGKKNLDLNMRDNHGKTALHLAIERKMLATVEDLLMAGADPSICDDQGKTAFDLANCCGDIELMTVLQRVEKELNDIKEKERLEKHQSTLNRLDVILKKSRSKRFP